MKRSSRRIAAFIFIIILISLTLIGLYKIPSPVSDALHTGYLRIRAMVASYDWGAPIPISPERLRTLPSDGMAQVFVPAGEFQMGTDETGSPRNRPTHTVKLDDYWIDQVEVTNAMYEMCVEAGECNAPIIERNPYYGHAQYRNYPVVFVTWFDAEAYCKWVGRRLPTEAEWEKAARGTDGRIYPWGNDSPDERHANFNLNIGALLNVDRYPLGVSPYGAFNMAGNVREWVADWFKLFYYKVSPSENPKGPLDGETKSLRGGAYDDNEGQIRTFNRFDHAPSSPGINRGFRCASDPE